MHRRGLGLEFLLSGIIQSPLEPDPLMSAFEQNGQNHGTAGAGDTIRGELKKDLDGSLARIFRALDGQSSFLSPFCNIVPERYPGSTTEYRTLFVTGVRHRALQTAETTYPFERKWRVFMDVVRTLRNSGKRGRLREIRKCLLLNWMGVFPQDCHHVEGDEEIGFGRGCGKAISMYNGYSSLRKLVC